MKLLDYWVPGILLDVLRYTKNWLRLLHYRRYIHKNRELKDIYNGKTVYILANGPSLNNFPIDQLEGKDVIVMNAFHLASWKNKVNIIAHCFGEPTNSTAWEDPRTMFNGTNAMSYWLHVSSKNRIDTSFLSGKQLRYVYPVVPTRLWRNSRKINLARPVIGYMTTAQLAIEVALHMGFKKIYLLGFDHDWLSNRNLSPHFYKENESVKPADLSGFSYYSLIKMVKEKWEIYYKLKHVATADKARIINLSRPTYLDVFSYNDKDEL